MSVTLDICWLSLTILKMEHRLHIVSQSFVDQINTLMN